MCFFRIPRPWRRRSGPPIIAPILPMIAVVQRHRGMRLGVLGREVQRGFQRIAHLAGDALLQGLRDRQALAVAPQREGVAVMAVRFVGQRLDRGFGQLRRLLETAGFSASPSTRCVAWMPNAFTATEAPAGQNFSPASNAAWKSPWWNFRHASCNAIGERFGIELGRGLAGGLEQFAGAPGVGEGFAVAGMQLQPAFFSASPA